MAVITKELARKIVKKLGASIQERKGRPHDLAQVFHNGKLIASFGIRRGSKKDLGHDHIPAAIHVSMAQARLLGQCPMSKEEWISVLAEKQLIQSD